MKKVISLILSILMLTSITAGIDFSALAAEYSTMTNACLYEIGTTFNGKIQNDTDEKDYLKVTLQNSGNVSFTIQGDFVSCKSGKEGNPSTADFSIFTESEIYSQFENPIFSNEIAYHSNLECNYLQRNIELLAGTYYIEISEHTNYDMNGTYSLQTVFTPSNESFEESVGNDNNLITKANKISINHSYNGQIALNDECDYYSITLNNGKYDFSINSKMFYEPYDYEQRAAKYTIYDANQNEVYCSNDELNKLTGKYEKIDTVSLTGGNYFVKIEGYSGNTGTYDFCIKVHSYNSKVTKRATLSANGIITYTCNSCGDTYTKTINKISKISLSTTSYTYNEKVKTPSVTVKDSKGNVLKKNTDYTVTYASGRKNVGKYFVKITFKGNYSGTKTLYFTIKPPVTAISSLSAGSKRFTAKWSKKSAQVTGYQIQYATNSSFKSAKTSTVTSYKTTSRTISKLTGKKRYYVRVRTYKKVGSTNYYSSWSKAKYITTRS